MSYGPRPSRVVRATAGGPWLLRRHRPPLSPAAARHPQRPPHSRRLRSARRRPRAAGLCSHTHTHTHTPTHLHSLARFALPRPPLREMRPAYRARRCLCIGPCRHCKRGWGGGGGSARSRRQCSATDGGGRTQRPASTPCRHQPSERCCTTSGTTPSSSHGTGCCSAPTGSINSSPPRRSPVRPPPCAPSDTQGKVGVG